ncbi:hypothetical protein [Actinomadura rubrisoli]|uniref:Secreted protein n=1 Tax=Actinomadura rubrisoli TaxID=2530368 RepID=A0A4R5CAG3_9ACTN|nr:hypothetical protein [Actinomadura rubrisoli]TDD96315.1 hypothetical protein E1298_03325 [Actinomadura rubrisoli]
MNFLGTRRNHWIMPLAGAIAMLGFAAQPAAATAPAPVVNYACGPEIEAGPVVYRACSEVTWTGPDDQYSAQGILFVSNRGINEADFTLTLERWDYTVGDWTTDTTDSDTLPSGDERPYFAPPRELPCGQDARERGEATVPTYSGDWSEVVLPAPC